MREPLNIQDYVAGLFQNDAADLANHALRASVLERMTALDAALNDVLAVRFGRDQDAADALSERVFSRLPMNDRIAMLREVVEDEGLAERWPYLLEVLPRISKLRNALAHGFVKRSPDGTVQITTYNRGVVRSVDYSAREIAWLAWQSDVTWNELRTLWAVLVPDVDDWFGPEPDPDTAQ